MDEAGSVWFEPLQRSDFPLLKRWLEEPLVARWWNHDSSKDGIEGYFGPCIDRSDPTEQLVAWAGGRPFGLLQLYRLADDPSDVVALSAVCAVPADAVSIDYLVGEPSARGRGLATAMIRAGVAEAWRRHPAARDVLVPVAAGNRASWRALERAGFVLVGVGELEPDNPVDPRDHVVYAARRPSVGAGRAQPAHE